MLFASYPFQECFSVYKTAEDSAYAFARAVFLFGNFTSPSAVVFQCVVRNIGDNPVTFKIQSAIRGTGLDFPTTTDISGETHTVVAGGYVNIDLQLENQENALQFVVTSSDASTLTFAGASTVDIDWVKETEKDYYREEMGGDSGYDGESIDMDPEDGAGGVYVAGFNIPPYDYISNTYYGSTNNVHVATYKSGGSGGTTVATLTFTYVGSGDADDDKVATVTKS